jgi:hypothetical protein
MSGMPFTRAGQDGALFMLTNAAPEQWTCSPNPAIVNQRCRSALAKACHSMLVESRR